LINEKAFLMRDKEGKTCLHAAAELGAINACRIILDNVGMGLINERNNKKQTPLHLATLNGQARAIKVLIDLGGSMYYF
jgi:ankyrin repeat protein